MFHVSCYDKIKACRKKERWSERVRERASTHGKTVLYEFGLRQWWDSDEYFTLLNICWMRFKKALPLNWLHWTKQIKSTGIVSATKL